MVFGPRVQIHYCLTAFTAIAVVAALSGCGGGSPATSPTAPANPGSSPASTFSVTSVTPASGATGIATNATVTVTFSSAANPATINTSDITLTGTNAVAGSVAWNAANNTATFTPGAALAANTTYTLNVSGGTSSSGTALSSSFKSTFTTAATQYSAPVFTFSDASTPHGQVTIDTNGNVTMQLTGATASYSFTVLFCPAFNSQPSSTLSVPPCVSLGTLSTDASGAASTTLLFPQPGQWAGEFEFKTGSTIDYQTTVFPGVSGETYQATLEPQSTVNGVGVTLDSQSGQPYPNQEPLTSGTVTYSNGTLQFTLKGTAPDLEFDTSESEYNYLYNSGNYQCSQFTTDASGDATSTITGSATSVCAPYGDMFQAFPADVNSSDSGAGFIGGFSVP